MKKILLIVSISAFIVYPIYSQNSSNNSEFNEQQTHFIEFMKVLCSEHRNRANDLDLNRFENKMNNYLYSIQPLIGWKGTISDIQHIRNKHLVSYSINFVLDEFNCTFQSFFSYETEKELRDHHLYNKLINTRNGSTVYFDGYIMVEKNLQRDDKLKYLQPLYILEISEIYITQPPLLSAQLLKQLSLSYQLYILYLKKKLEQITDQEFDEALILIPEVDTSLLTDEEKEYLYRYLKQLAPLLFKGIISNP